MSDTAYSPLPVGQLGDPWIGDPVQSLRRKALCQISVGGVDVTNNLEPFLISVRILDGWAVGYNCELELDDRDGRLPIPAAGTTVAVLLGWDSESMVKAYNGQIVDVEHGFGRKQGGRRMWVKAWGVDLTGGVKQPMQNHLGDGAPPGQQQGAMLPFSAMAQQVASAAGLTASIHPAIGSLMRDYWSQNNESAMHWFQRHAGEFGAITRGEGGNTLTMTVPGQNADGSTPGTITAAWGVNLLGWRVRPFVARSMWGNSRQQYFDQQKSLWTDVLSGGFNFASAFGGGGATQYMHPVPAPNQGVAQQQNNGAAQQVAVAQSEGRIVINGEPAASGNSYVQLIGARPGVDGVYWIETAEHVYSREGYITWLDVRTYVGAAPSYIAPVNAVYSQAYGPPSPFAGPPTPAATTTP